MRAGCAHTCPCAPLRGAPRPRVASLPPAHARAARRRAADGRVGPVGALAPARHARDARRDGLHGRPVLRRHDGRHRLPRDHGARRHAVRRSRRSAGPLHRRIRRGSIVGDAAEGYNPVHDVCRLVINSACKTLGVENYEFPLVGRLAVASSIACAVSDHQSTMAVRFPCTCGALSSKLPLSCARPRHASVKWP